ncbi:MAG: DUF465 domain-containing protein [Rhizobiales bacterium]|nr:DUF465 domain-containing protein [Hyphomicrobiales bacterium]
MALEARLNELKLKHKQMKEKISIEANFAAADGMKVKGLKQEKMKLKEEISNIEARMVN